MKHPVQLAVQADLISQATHQIKGHFSFFLVNQNELGSFGRTSCRSAAQHSGDKIKKHLLIFNHQASKMVVSEQKSFID